MPAKFGNKPIGPSKPSPRSKLLKQKKMAAKKAGGKPPRGKVPGRSPRRPMGVR